MTNQSLLAFAPCPFCGGEDVDYWTVSSSRDPLLIDAQHVVGCNSCGATLSDDDEEETRERWNRRASRLPDESRTASADEVAEVTDEMVGRALDEFQKVRSYMLPSDMLRAVLKAALAHDRRGDGLIPVKPAGAVAGNYSYFCYDGDNFDTFKTLDEARKAANDALDHYREDAPDGWNDEVENICFGVVTGEIVMTEERPIEPGDNCASGIDTWVDYGFDETPLPAMLAAAPTDTPDAKEG